MGFYKKTTVLRSNFVDYLIPDNEYLTSDSKLIEPFILSKVTDGITTETCGLGLQFQFGVHFDNHKRL